MDFFPAADAAGVSSWSGTLPSTVPTGLGFAFQAVVTQGGAPALGSNPVERTITAGTCTNDAYEANDTPATAFAFASTPALITDAVVCNQEEDWYTFDVVAGDVVDVTGTVDLADGDIDFLLYDSAGTLLTAGYPASPITAYTVPADDTYGLRVVEFDDADGDDAVAYDLEITATPGTPPTTCTADAFEPNEDAFGALTSFALGQTILDLSACVADEIDGYTVDLTAGQEISFTALHTASEGDIDLYLFDAPQTNDLTTLNANYLARGYTGLDDDGFTYTVTADGTYYVAVRLYGDSGIAVLDGNNYDLELLDITP